MASGPQSHYAQLAARLISKHHELKRDLWKEHAPYLEQLKNVQPHILAGSVAGLLLLSQPLTLDMLAQNQDSAQRLEFPAIDRRLQLVNSLRSLLPGQVEPLNEAQEDAVAHMLSDAFGLAVKPVLEGKRLNRSYGYIGAEQHLMRYPGDTMATHFDNPEDSEKYYSSGMAPGRGAWGYFAYSKEGMSEKDVMREKYYIAVQTFLAPGWHSDVRGHYAFFKYRKMLVVNPDNGKAIVADIADAGPAEFTGKHLGGSPEVMKYLERVDGRAKGPVIYMFIDDPAEVVPLGPVTVQ